MNRLLFYFTLGISLFILGLTSEAFSQEPFVRPVEPEPFRRDDEEIFGRDFNYNDESFLSRFTYRFRPEWQKIWDSNPSGYRVTAGSVRTDELYVVQVLQKSLDLNEWVLGTIRHRVDEDYDSRYDRTLVGVGVKFLENWSISLLSDFVATKEDLDLHFELRWTGNNNNSFRAAFIAVDHFFNEKSDEQEYNKRPYTYFAEGKLNLPAKSLLHGWINLNPRLELVQESDNSRFNYEQYTGGVKLLAPLGSFSELLFSYEGQKGDRSNIGDPGFIDERHFERHTNIIDTQVQFKIIENFSVWVGTRYYYFDEQDVRPNDLENSGTVDRKEQVYHSGIVWLVNESVTFSPGIFVAPLDNSYNYPDNEERNGRSSQTIGRITLPIEYRFNPGFDCIVNPTLEFPGGPFGGLNVQFQVQF